MDEFTKLFELYTKQLNDNSLIIDMSSYVYDTELKILIFMKQNIFKFVETILKENKECIDLIGDINYNQCQCWETEVDCAYSKEIQDILRRKYKWKDK